MIFRKTCGHTQGLLYVPTRPSVLFGKTFCICGRLQLWDLLWFSARLSTLCSSARPSVFFCKILYVFFCKTFTYMFFSNTVYGVLKDLLWFPARPSLFVCKYLLWYPARLSIFSKTLYGLLQDLLQNRCSVARNCCVSSLALLPELPCSAVRACMSSSKSLLVRLQAAAIFCC